MEELFFTLAELIERIGVFYSLLILLFFFFLTFGFVYMIAEIEPYIRGASIQNLKYGSYEVEVKNNDEVIKVVTVKAFGKGQAVEKVSKNLDGTYFIPTKL